ncbi:hypothetical protein [Paenibacillus wenxiniae]|uniref:MAE-28990/MAE-18760-like HEPN domain-containing protein n=1 Tax=Paenibacillus wenxiniae TaxID=1636843 RepID=A0ABW4RGV6_9BACL
MNEQLDDYDFPKEVTDLSKAITKTILDYFESVYKIDMRGSFHQYQLLRILFCLQADKGELILDSLLETVEFIVDTHDSNTEVMNDLVRISFKKRDEALYHFWEYHSKAKLLKDENLSFRKKTSYRFSMIHQISEHMLKREAYLLYAAFQVSNVENVKKDIALNDTIQMLLLLPFEYFKNIDSHKLKDISINQWRNIAAHSSYECKNETIEIAYSNNKTKTISLKELDIVISEIYSLRIFVKTVTNLCLDILQIKFPEYIEESRYVPETTMIDINAYYEKFETKITKFELSDSVRINDLLYKVEGESYFKIEIESTYSDRLEVVKLTFLSLIQLSKTINEYNCTVKLEDIVWVFEILFMEDNAVLVLSISYDEVSLLVKYPEEYLVMLERKLSEPNAAYIRSILKIE